MKIERRDGADERLIGQAADLARRLKAAKREPAAGSGRTQEDRLTEAYKRTVDKLGYDPIS